MKKTTTFLLVSLLCSFAPIISVRAASAGDIVINEIAWMGSIDETNDEYIELYNTTGNAVDVSGWYIEDDATTTYSIVSGTIPAHGYFLIEDREESVNTMPADAIVGLSLANTGDTLILYASGGTVIDTVNSSGSAWFAGDNTSKATMERIDSSSTGDDAANWADNTASSGEKGALGNAIQGTPKTLNSVSTAPSGTTVSLTGGVPLPGQNFVVTGQIANVNGLFSYGAEIIYDQTQLSLIGVDRGTFLNQNGTVSSSFHYGLDSLNNHIVLGEARLQDSKTAVDGSGALFTLTFNVQGAEGAVGTIDITGGSFLGGLTSDVSTQFQDFAYTIGGGPNPNQVQNLTVTQDTSRYALKLTWEAPVNGGDSYKIYRKNPHNVSVLLGTTTTLTFTDNDTLTDGGDLVPDVQYTYEVSAILSGVESSPVSATGKETRGVRGDNNRNDRVDGRDLENLALHFAEDDTHAEFNPLIDTGYDGYIDGDDLIHIGANWAQNYQ